MKKLNVLFFPLLVFLVFFSQTAYSQTLTFDNQVIKGKLDNGLTYFLRENKKTEKNV
jgi:hypothetical protein